MRRLATLLSISAAVLAAGAAAAPAQDGGTTLCHATGNPGAPYVEITVGPEGPGPHANHPDDVIPAPAGGCAAIGQAAPTPTPTATPTPTPVETPEPDQIPEPAPEREEREDRRGDDRDDATAGGGDDGGSGSTPHAQIPPAQPPPADLTAGASAGDFLPVTGGESLLVAMTGLGLLMTGAGLRLRQGPERS